MKAHGGDTDDSNTSQDLYGQDNNRCTVKCTQGSSTFTTGEMKNLIDGIFDRLAEMGVNDPVVTAYWQEWSEP